MGYNKEQYLTSLDEWMKYYGYTQYSPPAELNADRMFWKRSFNASKFGNVDTYCFAKYVKENADGALLQSFSMQTFDYSYKIRQGGPLGLGNMLVVFPLLITEKISTELYAFLKNYCPKHFAAAEFPSTLDLASGSLYHYELTPVWGAFYYDGYRRDSYNLFSPQSWKNVSDKS